MPCGMDASGRIAFAIFEVKYHVYILSGKIGGLEWKEKY